MTSHRTRRPRPPGDHAGRGGHPADGAGRRRPGAGGLPGRAGHRPGQLRDQRRLGGLRRGEDPGAPVHRRRWWRGGAGLGGRFPGFGPAGVWRGRRAQRLRPSRLSSPRDRRRSIGTVSASSASHARSGHVNRARAPGLPRSATASDNPSGDTARETIRKISFKPQAEDHPIPVSKPSSRRTRDETDRRPSEHLPRWHRFSAPTGTGAVREVPGGSARCVVELGIRVPSARRRPSSPAGSRLTSGRAWPGSHGCDHGMRRAAELLVRACPVVPLAAGCGDEPGKHAGVPPGRPSPEQR